MNQTIKKIATAWHNFWFIQMDPFIFGVYRIYLGILLTIYYLLVSPSWLIYYGPAGISAATIKSLTNYQLFDSVLAFVTTNQGYWLIWGLSLFCAIMLIFGLLGRLPIVWLWLMNFSIISRNSYAVNGEEQILAPLLLFSLFLPLTASLSLQNRGIGRKNQNKARKVTVWALRPVQIYIALIYLISWPIKVLSDEAWRNGTVVYYALNSISYARWPGLEIFSWGNAFLSRLATYYTLLVELLFPLFVWFKRFRMPLTLAIIFMQLSLAVLLSGVWVFNLATVAGLILFLPSRQTRLWSQKVFPKSATVLYDGDCGLCQRSVSWLRMLDREERVKFLNFRESQTRERFPQLEYDNLQKEMHLVTHHSKIFKGFYVYRYLARVIPALYPALILVYLPGSSFIGVKTYQLIAKYRYRFGSKCHTCQIKKHE
jgi:predicted DCC family thiol-disulfide oxidoreductase YuxK